MTAADPAKLSLREKLQFMVAIWEDLRRRVDAMDVPEEHRQILDERRSLVASGEAMILDWDQVRIGDHQGPMALNRELSLACVFSSGLSAARLAGWFGIDHPGSGLW